MKRGHSFPRSSVGTPEVYRVMCDARLLTLEGVDRKAASCSEDVMLDLNAVYTALKMETTEDFDPEDMDEARLDRVGKRGEKARVSALAFGDGHRTTALLAGAKAASGAKTNIWQLAAALCYCESDDPDTNIEDLWGAQMAARAIL